LFKVAECVRSPLALGVDAFKPLAADFAQHEQTLALAKRQFLIGSRLPHRTDEHAANSNNKRDKNNAKRNKTNRKKITLKSNTPRTARIDIILLLFAVPHASQHNATATQQKHKTKKTQQSI